MTRDQVFIANMVKCRPPDNRDPTPAEIGACSKYLDRQIELIDPRLIVTLGRFSTARFLPGQSISRVRGRLRQSNGRHVFPIMHPAAGLRRQEMRQAIEEDFAKVPGLLDVLRMEGSQPANPGHIRESTHPYLPTPPRYVPVQSSLFGDPVPPSELHEETTDRSDPVQPPSGQPPSDEPPSDNHLPTNHLPTTTFRRTTFRRTTFRRTTFRRTTFRRTTFRRTTFRRTTFRRTTFRRTTFRSTTFRSTTTILRLITCQVSPQIPSPVLLLYALFRWAASGKSGRT